MKAIEITFKNSRWLVNGKRLEEMNQDEKDFMDDFFREFKATIELDEMHKSRLSAKENQVIDDQITSIKYGTITENTRNAFSTGHSIGRGKGSMVSIQKQINQ